MSDDSGSSSGHDVGGCWIPPYVMGDSELTMAQKVVYGRIEALSTKDGYCWAGNEGLSQKLDLSPRQVRRHVGKLVSKGYLRRQLIRNSNGVVTQRRLFPLNPQATSQEDACDLTPPPREDGTVQGVGTDPSSWDGRIRPVEYRGTEKLESEKRDGGSRAKRDQKDSEQRASGPEDVEITLPSRANLAGGFDPDCEDCWQAAEGRGGREACPEHYVATHERDAPTQVEAVSKLSEGAGRKQRTGLASHLER